MGDHHDLLAPGAGPKYLKHLPKQRVFGLIVSSAVASRQREIDWHAIDATVGHDDHDLEAKDVRVVPAQTRFLGHRMLLPPLALQGTVTDERQDAILQRGKGLQGLLSTPLQQRLRAPGDSASQTAVVLMAEIGRPMPGRGLEVGSLSIEQVQDQQPTEHQLVPMAEARTQHPQALRHASGQTGQGHSLGLLADMRSVGR